MNSPEYNRKMILNQLDFNFFYEGNIK